MVKSPKVGDTILYNSTSLKMTAIVYAVSASLYNTLYCAKNIKVLYGNWDRKEVHFSSEDLCHMSIVTKEPINTDYCISAKNGKQISGTVKRIEHAKI